MVCSIKKFWGNWAIPWCIDMGAKLVPPGIAYEVRSMAGWQWVSSYWIGAVLKNYAEGIITCSKIHLWADWT